MRIYLSSTCADMAICGRFAQRRARVWQRQLEPDLENCAVEDSPVTGSVVRLKEDATWMSESRFEMGERPFQAARDSRFQSSWVVCSTRPGPKKRCDERTSQNDTLTIFDGLTTKLGEQLRSFKALADNRDLSKKCMAGRL